MSYVWDLPPKNLLLMREADAWATPRVVRTEMEVMCWEGQGEPICSDLEEKENSPRKLGFAGERRLE